MTKAIFIMGPVNSVHMPRNHCRHGYVGPGRPMKPRVLRGPSNYSSFTPSSGIASEPIAIDPDEVEALRLVDYLGLNQEEAAQSMGVSRGTVWRCVDSGRRKLISMVIEGRPLSVENVNDSSDNC